MPAGPKRTPPNSASRAGAASRAADGCGWTRGPPAPGQAVPRPSWTEAQDGAADLLRAAGWDRALRLLGPGHGSDLRFVDEVALLGWLAGAIRSGALVPAGGGAGPESAGRWMAVRVLGAPRVLVDVARRQPGLRRMPLDKPGLAARAVEALWANAPAREHLLSLLSATGRVDPQLGEPGLKALAAKRLGEGAISLFFREEPGGAEEAAQPPPAERRSPTSSDGGSSAPTAVDHWIEIVLVDQDGNPMPGETYEVTLPDKSLRRGVLDDKGKAKITGIAPGGACQVGFPDIDAREWRPA